MILRTLINDHIIFLRQLEKPTVYAIRNFNKEFDIHKNKLIAIPLEVIVNDFNTMFKEYRIILKKMTFEQMVNDFEKKKQL